MRSMGSKNPSFLHADSEDSDQTGRVSRLFFARRTWPFVGGLRYKCSISVPLASSVMIFRVLVSESF